MYIQINFHHTHKFVLDRFCQNCGENIIYFGLCPDSDVFLLEYSLICLGGYRLYRLTVTMTHGRAVRGRFSSVCKNSYKSAP